MSNKSGRFKKRGKVSNTTGADLIDYQNSTWTSSPPKTINNKKRSFEFSPKSISNNNNKMSASLTDKPDVKTQRKSQELLYNTLSNRTKRNVKKHPKASSSALLKKSNKSKSKEKKKWGWRSRTSDPMTKDIEVLKESRTLSPTNGKNLIIKINHVNKSDKNSSKNAKHSNKNNVIFDINSEQQILGDIFIHVSSWNQLKAKNDILKHKQNQTKKILGVGWKKIYSVLDQQTLRFWDSNTQHTSADDQKQENKGNNSDCIVVYLSEILTLSKSIRSIDGEKYIIELNICGLKCLLSFNNIEQREYWHSLLSDYHLNYFVWRSTPLDEKKRRSQNVINGVYTMLSNKKQMSKKSNTDTLNILYIEEILQKISALHITKIIDIVPSECKFMSGRLVRVIMSIKFFFMSVLKSLSGADIPLPSRDILIGYLDEITEIKWSNVSKEILDFYCDKCYRIMFNLSFAFTSNARDEIMKLTDYNKQKMENSTNGNGTTEKRVAEMKFEYESLQRSWKMHRDRLQEYVMAYRDAVAKLKHSYHQRDSLCKKLESLVKEKQKLNESIQLQHKTYNQTMEEAHKLTQKFSVLSQQMQGMQMQSTMQQNLGSGYVNQGFNAQYQMQQFPSYQQQMNVNMAQNIGMGQGYANSNNSNVYQPGSVQQMQGSNNNNIRMNMSDKSEENTSTQIQQISQEMTNLFAPNTNDKYTWI